MNEENYTEQNHLEEAQPEFARQEEDIHQDAPAPRIVKRKSGESRSRKFWRIVFGSALGFILVNVVTSILGIILLLALIGSSIHSDTTAISDNSVLALTLNAPIVERGEDNPFEDLDMGAYSQSTIGLDDLLEVIKTASNDNKIKGISLNIKQLQAAPASLSEIRDALQNFKKSGKFIYAYSDSYGQGSYYLSSVADSIFLNPLGDVSIHGMASQIMFYKGLIDKLDIDVQVVKCGKFKSAVEPYLMDKMSDANREQMEVLLNSIWTNLTTDMAKSRQLKLADINQVADELLISQGTDAVKLGFVDRLCYSGEYALILKKRMGLAQDATLNLVSFKDYKKHLSSDIAKQLNIAKGDKIAVVYAVGEIIDGKGNMTTIGSETLCREIRRAYKDKDVKAIVLRVNSPGGSAMASDIIWNEIECAKAAGKIVVTSMGDYAASGGYYISCNSDAIVAQPNTLTGSIGVFGIIPDLQECFKNKLGITIDVAKTNAHADAFSAMRPMTEEEYAYMQHSVDIIYGTFLSRVANGRKMKVEDVDAIAQGRVWSGTDAIKIGLVDQLGNLDTAIEKAAQMAKINDYTLVYYPQKQAWYEVLLNKENREQDVAVSIRNELGELYPAFETIRQITTMKGIQARMPMEITIGL